jgi:hypothetical protein
MPRGEAAVVAAAVGALGVLAAARRDYRRWTALGEGGIPHGMKGWAQMTALRLRNHPDVTATTQFGTGGESALADLPLRSGARPVVAPYPIPHRQADWVSPPEVLAALDAVFAAELESRRSCVREDTSRYERHHSALFVDAVALRTNAVHGEIAHIHRPQGSMHIHLRPADAGVVIERGWGELHPLSGRGFGLPASYTLLYAPRGIGEVDVVRRILSATLDWACQSG